MGGGKLVERGELAARLPTQCLIRNMATRRVDVGALCLTYVASLVPFDKFSLGAEIY